MHINSVKITPTLLRAKCILIHATFRKSEHEVENMSIVAMFLMCEIVVQESLND